MKRLMTLFLMVACATVAAEPFYEGEIIFPLQEKHCHSSSIVECPNGDLLVCWFYGSGERSADDVVVQGARRGKGEAEWSPVFQMADTYDIPDCNPVLFVDDQDTLWLFWIAVPAKKWEECILRYKRTRDYLGDGPPNWEWQDIIVLKPGDRFAEAVEVGVREAGYTDDCWGNYAPGPEDSLVEAAKDPAKRQSGWMTRTHPIILPSGRYILPLYSDGYYLGIMALSDDRGETWRASGPIPGIGLNQPSVVRKKDGTLVAYMRDEGPQPKRIPVSYSMDDGDTWTTAVDSDIPNPDSSVEAIALADGRWVMAYNDTERGRHSLALALSDDEGATWKWQRHLEVAELHQGSYGYPSVIQAEDGLIHVTYTYDTRQEGPHKSIKHVAVNPEWIMQGD